MSMNVAVLHHDHHPRQPVVLPNLKISNDGHFAEIFLLPTSKPIGADELVRVMLAHGITAAKIVRNLQRKDSIR